MIYLISATGFLGTAGQINYYSSKTARSVMLKVLTAAFFRRNIADKIIKQVPIGRLIEPEEVISLVTELYKNEIMAGDTVFIQGGLRLGSQE